MHLRTIRLRGFKSFVDPLELTLEPGVAVVVGPNGSGKSNVADAIVWAAGSLTPSELRAERPDDVLFAGGGERKQAEHCEVELVFDNEDGGFGELDFSEISITRRLVRGGEGQYLVNRAPVRRTDLVELLADVGLGGAMHSIVSQGKVDAVLASKPEDRRELIEEAAGLGKFKRRRHRAELKLARVGVQVERARDVEAEVRKRLRPLALQATAAERAEKLVGEIASLRARLADLDLGVIAERRIAEEERRDAAALARRTTGEQLTELLRERQSVEDELSDSAGRREAALGALYRLQGASERLQLRRENTGALHDALGADVVDAERAGSARTDDAVRELEEAARAAAETSRESAQTAARTGERARLAHARLAVLERRQADASERRLAELRERRTDAEAQLSDATAGPDAAGLHLARLGSMHERLVAREESAGTLHASLHDALDAARSLARGGGPPPKELARIADEAAARARSAASERDEIAERARSAAERLRALERTIAEREGLPPAARMLAGEGERLVLSALAVDPGSERAVAAALGARASAVIADDPRAGLALLRRAHAAGLGSLTVVTGSDPGDLVARLPVVSAEALLDVVAPSVTVEGFGYDPDAGELWFAGETAEAVLLEMDARRRALADEADELSARAAAARASAEDAAAAASEAEASFADVAHLRDRSVDVAQLGRLESASRSLMELLARSRSVAFSVEEPVAARAAVDREQALELGAELRRLSGREADAARETADAVERAQAAEVVVVRLGGSLDGAHVDDDADRDVLEREAVEALATFDATTAAAGQAADAATDAERRLLERSPRRAALDVDLLRRLATAAGGLGAGLDGAITLAERLQAPVRARVDAGAERATRLGDELRRLGAAEVGLRKRADEAGERETQVRVELTRLDAEQAEAERRRADAGDAEPAAGDDRDELSTRAERLESRRETLGRVNPLAKEEYEEAKARLDELSVQRQDLEDSLAELEKLRDDLTQTVERRFAETFAAVAANFEEVAATLFPGGSGRLRLVERDEESGEHGVEVELRPAGKRITRLSLLSGGEKALGAISFLFALFLAKPCPFYLLDEVEAALDDANITRFVDLLRRYADRAQFVVITHQKRTMEAADVLYGVTMGADGVSQVVSRRLPQHDRQPVAATA